ncbi:MAG: glycosyltransferase [Rhizobiaceae bacterium]
MFNLVEGPGVRNGINATGLSSPDEAVAETIFNTSRYRQYLDHDIDFLHAFGIGKPALLQAQARGVQFQVTSAEALISNGDISEEDYFRCVAFELGLEFVHSTPASATPLYRLPSPPDLERMARMVRVSDVDAFEEIGPIHLAPDCREMPRLKKLLEQNPSLAKRLKITTLSANKKSIESRSAQSLLAVSINGLREGFPSFSARRVVSVSQALVLAFGIQLMLLLSFASTSGVLLVLHLIASAFYLGCIGLRLFATLSFSASERRIPETSLDYSQDGALPIYSVLVALYQEAGQVDDLVDSLLKLDWPKERLEIKLICEADDLPTIEAVWRAKRRVKSSTIVLVEVPPSTPRTKPKALNYALPLCKGRLLVIYDAEDRPDPRQLREAYSAFKNGPPELACLQAPLIIHNHGESWLSKMFAIEYSSLFDGLLPMLARANAPLPLGGTSNHFKRTVLEQVGAWDPYNVTEDADLGMRLARVGYRIDTIRRPTYEEAPINFSVWLKQRTRWFKGWFQTWLVHMRHPIALSRDLGLKGTIVFHLMISGMVISALVHPILLYFIAVRGIEFYQQGAMATIAQPLFLLDLATITLGYGTFAALAWLTLPVRGLTKLRSAFWGIPFYWMLLSIAAWRALWHLIRRPHEWEKTPHRLRIKKAT